MGSSSSLTNRRSTHASRWAPSPLRDVVYTLLFNTLVAVAFTALATLFVQRIDLGRQFAVCFVYSQLIGYTIWLLMLAAGKGSVITLSADGPDAEAALDGLATLVADRFGEGE